MHLRVPLSLLRWKRLADYLPPAWNKRHFHAQYWVFSHDGFLLATCASFGPGNCCAGACRYWILAIIIICCLGLETWAFFCVVDMKLDCEPGFVTLVWTDSRALADTSLFRLGSCVPTSVSPREAVFTVDVNDCNFSRMVGQASHSSVDLGGPCWLNAVCLL